MARVKFSAFIDQVSGSVGGTTLQRNAYGFTMRNKPRPVSNSSTGQSVMNEYLHRVSQAWQLLTSDDRLAWEAYAGSYPIKSKYNPDSILSGYNVFCQINLHRLRALLSILTIPSMELESVPVVVSNFLRSNGTNLRWITTPSGGTGLWYISLFATLPIKSSNSYVSLPLKHIRSRQFDSAGTANIISFYASAFGVRPTFGDIVGFRTVIFCRTTAQSFIIDTVPSTIIEE